MKEKAEQAGSRLMYKLDTDEGEQYLDSQWWDLPDEVQPDLEIALQEYARQLNSLGA